MELTNELTIEFINIYEKYPILWDPMHLNHKNRNYINDAWNDIAKEVRMDISIEVLKKKKESLMSTYRNLAKKVRRSETSGSGVQDVYVPSWFAYNAIDRFVRATGKKIPSLNSEVILFHIIHNKDNNTDNNIYYLMQ